MDDGVIREGYANILGPVDIEERVMLALLKGG